MPPSQTGVVERLDGGVEHASRAPRHVHRGHGLGDDDVGDGPEGVGRRALPQRSHLPYMALDREARVKVNKLAAILRLANALDADHLQKVADVRLIAEENEWVLEVEGAGDLTMERLAAQARSDLITEVFGRRLGFREARTRAWP